MGPRRRGPGGGRVGSNPQTRRQSHEGVDCHLVFSSTSAVDRRNPATESGTHGGTHGAGGCLEDSDSSPTDGTDGGCVSRRTFGPPPSCRPEWDTLVSVSEARQQHPSRTPKGTGDDRTDPEESAPGAPDVESRH